MNIAGSLERCWYMPQAAPVWWTLPLSALYAAGSASRRALYRHGWLRAEQLPVPVIVVGNITVGGTGKTPLTIALVDALRERGWNPAVVSRGYGGSSSTPRRLDASPDPAVVGDEPALIRMRTGAPVAVGANRPATARLLVGQGADVIVADDGLQHYALARDLAICVVDGLRRFGNRRQLPAGPLREPESRLHDVDFVVCNGGAPHEQEVPMQLVLDGWVAIGHTGRPQPLAALAGRRVHAVAGIGNPPRFFDALRDSGIEPIAHPFPDHHQFTAGELDFGDDRALLMTEKDAVKCRAFAKDNWYAVPASAQLPETFFDAVARRIADMRGSSNHAPQFRQP
jgi:tetraacyldisaccharide 4'-kinase